MHSPNKECTLLLKYKDGDEFIENTPLNRIIKKIQPSPFCVNYID